MMLGQRISLGLLSLAGLAHSLPTMEKRQELGEEQNLAARQSTSYDCSPSHLLLEEMKLELLLSDYVGANFDGKLPVGSYLYLIEYIRNLAYCGFEVNPEDVFNFGFPIVGGLVPDPTVPGGPLEPDVPIPGGPMEPDIPSEGGEMVPDPVVTVTLSPGAVSTGAAKAKRQFKVWPGKTSGIIPAKPVPGGAMVPDTPYVYTPPKEKRQELVKNPFDGSTFFQPDEPCAAGECTSFFGDIPKNKEKRQQLVKNPFDGSTFFQPDEPCAAGECTSFFTDVPKEKAKRQELVKNPFDGSTFFQPDEPCAAGECTSFFSDIPKEKRQDVPIQNPFDDEIFWVPDTPCPEEGCGIGRRSANPTDSPIFIIGTGSSGFWMGDPPKKEKRTTVTGLGLEAKEGSCTDSVKMELLTQLADHESMFGKAYDGALTEEEFLWRQALVIALYINCAIVYDGWKKVLLDGGAVWMGPIESEGPYPSD